LTATATGQQWEIDPTEFEVETAQVESNDTSDTNDRDDAPNDANDTEAATLSTQTTDVTTQEAPFDATPATETTPEATTQATVTTPTKGGNHTFYAEKYVAQLESENKFLRSSLEARDRDAAELRTALRKALEVMPKQLNAGTPDRIEEKIPVVETVALSDSEPSKRTIWQRFKLRKLT
jgi:hypothetical protein